MAKLYSSAIESIEDIIKDGMTIMAGGFGLCGIPENLIDAISKLGTKDLTFISNNCGVDDFGLGILLRNGQIRKMISSYVGENKIFEKLMLSGELDVEIVPQGTLAERIRAGGAGVAGFYTPTGCRTTVTNNKEVRNFGDKEYVLELALKADLAIIKAFKADKIGNLQYRKTARNFNPVMATAADTVVCEVEGFVANIDPENIHTPCIFVDRFLVGHKYEKRIENLTLSE